MIKAYEKYTERMRYENQFIITPTYEYFENNTIKEIEAVVEQYPNILDYGYVLDQYAVEDLPEAYKEVESLCVTI